VRLPFKEDAYFNADYFTALNQVTRSMSLSFCHKIFWEMRMVYRLNALSEIAPRRKSLLTCVAVARPILTPFPTLDDKDRAPFKSW